jgi:hypothetical protein
VCSIGLLKLSTFGFFLLGSFIDIVLIASQVEYQGRSMYCYGFIPLCPVVKVVGPSDGSDYYMPYYGPRIIHLSENKETYYKPIN